MIKLLTNNEMRKAYFLVVKPEDNA